MKMRDEISARLAEATTSGNNWNGWPDKLELVGVRRYDLRDPKQAYQAGKLMGSGVAGAYRQVRPDQMPTELRGDRHPHALVFTYFVLASPRGQSDDEATRNLLAVYEEHPVKGDWNRTDVVQVEIGCKHDYETRSPYPMSHEGKCKRCGHTYYVDTSD